ncbi:MAG: ABC transporter permease subunit [Acidimicrobiia bacterium]|nr:ABC transporter permease subunit [Acidimicrobiia bacterium]
MAGLRAVDLVLRLPRASRPRLGPGAAHGGARLRAGLRRPRPVRGGDTAAEQPLRRQGLRLPGIQSLQGAIVVLTGVLYPYVYILGRSAFLGAVPPVAARPARSLGLTYGQALRRVAVPLARPALAAGASLAVMEALADFGAVDLLGVQALTSVIYRVWYGTFDQAAALQLSTVLVGLALTMVAIERLFRGRARYEQALGAGDAVVPVPLRSWKRWLAALPGWVLLALVFVIPVVQLATWSVETILDGTVDPRPGRRRAQHPAAGCWSTASVAVVTSTIVAYGQRVRPTPGRPRLLALWPRSGTPCRARWSPSRCTCPSCGSTVDSSTPRAAPCGATSTSSSPGPCSG